MRYVKVGGEGAEGEALAARWAEVLTFALGDLPAPGPAPKELNAHHNSTSSPSDSSRVRQMKMTKRVSTKGSSSGAAVYW